MWEQVLYGNMLLVVEDRDCLSSQRSLNTGRGQLVKAAEQVFYAQGRRAGMWGILMSCQDVELWWIRPTGAVTSGLLLLSLSAASPGLQLLFRVLCADAGHLGYFPPMPLPSFKCGGFCFGGAQRLTTWVGPDSAEQAAKNRLRFHQLVCHSGQQMFSAVAECGALPAQDAILKFHCNAAKEVRTGAVVT